VAVFESHVVRIYDTAITSPMKLEPKRKNLKFFLIIFHGINFYVPYGNFGKHEKNMKENPTQLPRLNSIPEINKLV
jgi:hypothetical protein